MGVLKNISSIKKSLKLRNNENSIGREIVAQSNIQEAFLMGYASFASGLMSMLEKLLITDGYHAVTYRSKNNGEFDKYLRYTLKDPQFSESFHITQKVGGEFEYSLIEGFNEVDPNIETEDDVLTFDTEDSNVFFL